MTFAQKKFLQSLNNKSHFLILAAFTIISAFSATSPSAHAVDVTLAWNSVDDASGYILHCGLASRTYNDITDVGNDLQYSLTQLSENQLYYCAVTAYNEFDESEYSDEVSFKTDASDRNEPPVADAEADQTVDEADTVILDGSYSFDPDDGIATYLWEQTKGKAVDLSDSGAIEPSFIAPEVGAIGDTLIFRLTVTDYHGAADSDTIKVDVNDIDEPAEEVDYCESIGWSFNSLWIGRVTFGNNSYSSGANGYSDFTSKVIEVQKAKSYQVELSSEPRYSMQLKYWGVWADFNQDGDFDDPGESLVKKRSGSGTISAQITIPSNALEGYTRLRVTMGSFIYPNSCGYVSYGEVEDYTLYIAGD